MSESSGFVALHTGHSWPLRWVAGVVVTTMFVVLDVSSTTKADSRQYYVVAQVDAKNAELSQGEVVVKIGDLSLPATAIKASPEIPRNIAIVIDAGPDQTNVLSKEKDLAIALINGLSGENTSFTIISVGTTPKMQAPSQIQSVAVDFIRDIAGERGKKTNVPIYDAIGSAIRQISLASGLRVVIFVGEGNDGGSRFSYAELRNLAESNQVTFFAALVADHSLHGTKSTLRYGWYLRELTTDTAGIFLENQKTPSATRQLRDRAEALRLIAFEMPSMQSGHYKISVSIRRGKRLRVQKAIVVP
jgi:hypothetical protein